jgi:carbon-monoxide dehydrogenase medium subunit
MWSHYLQPSSIDETLALLAQHREQARIINGGTDLLIEIERKLRTPAVVIDVSRIAGLDEIRIEPQTSAVSTQFVASEVSQLVHIGAGVTHNQVVAHPVLRERAYTLVRACWEVGAPQIRNRGTVAGNLITASPANDTITPLWALGATITLQSTRGTRTLTCPEFFKGVRRTALEPDELLTEIAFPLPNANTRSTFLKLGLRRAQAISVVNIAAVVEMGELKKIKGNRITLGSVAPTIVEVTEAQQCLLGKTLDDVTIDEAARLAMKAAQPIDDVRGTAEYRRALVGVYVARALRQLRDGVERDGFPEKPVMLWGKETNSQPSKPNYQSANHAVITAIEATVNGQRYVVNGDHHKTLLRFLREDLQLTGTKEGCAEGECGACTVFLDGIAVMSCLVPAPRAQGAEITTIEGIIANPQSSSSLGDIIPNPKLHPLQQALIDEGGVQCGYCTPGFVMSGVKLLEENPSPALADIRQAITGNLCRCTGYTKIVRAIEQAAKQ